MNNIDYNNCCKECLTFSHSLHLVPAFFTVSPDPLIMSYGEKLPDSQKKYIDRLMKVFQAQINALYDVPYMSYHYEFNKAGNLHIHGLIGLPETYSGYLKHTIIIQKMLHRLFGRPHNPSEYAGKTEWVKDEYRICEYINKENVYPPIHHIKTKNSLEDLICKRHGDNIFDIE